MNSSPAFLALLSCMLVASSLAATPNVFGVPLTCSGLCNAECETSDASCRVIPGLGALCDANLAACNSLCDTACTCLDGCTSRCQSNQVECVGPEGDLVDTALCTAEQATCLTTCPIKCGFKTGTSLFNNALAMVTGIIFPAPVPIR